MPNTSNKLATFFWGVAACLIVAAIVQHPDKAFQSSLQGLTVWWNIVFPALFPFLIAAQLLLAYGFAETAGRVLQPFARLLFDVPGIGGWAIAASFLAGYPAGAAVTGRLRRQGRITRSEGERLLAVSHVASPVLILGVIAAGFFENARLGLLLASVHYLSAFATGLIMRFVFRGKGEAKQSALGIDGEAPLIPFEEGGFGKQLGDAVYQSVQTMLIIGGYMMFFAVVVRMLVLSGLPCVLEAGAAWLGLPGAMSSGFASTMFSGLLEVHLGTYALSEGPVPGVLAAACTGLFLGWSGLCLHVQVRSQIADTDLRYGPFLISRLLHGLLAFLFTYWSWGPLNRLFNTPQARTVATFYPRFNEMKVSGLPNLWPYFSFTFLYVLLMLAWISYRSRAGARRG